MMLNMGMRHFKVRLFRKPGLGVCHGDDLFYLFPFKMPGFPAALVSETDVRVSKDLVEKLMTFAATGDPNCRDAKPTWQPYDNSEARLLCVDRDGKTEVRSNQDDRALSQFFNQIADDVRDEPLPDNPVTEIFSATAEKRQHVGLCKSLCCCCS